MELFDLLRRFSSVAEKGIIWVKSDRGTVSDRNFTVPEPVQIAPGYGGVHGEVLARVAATPEVQTGSDDYLAGEPACLRA